MDKNEQFAADLAANEKASDKLDRELNLPASGETRELNRPKDNKPKLQFDKDGNLVLDNDTNKETVIVTGKEDDSSPNKAKSQSKVPVENVNKNMTASPDYDTNKEVLNRTNEEMAMTSLRTMPDGSKALIDPVEKIVEGSRVDKNRLHYKDAQEGETSQQQKVRIMQQIHTILKIGGMDSQQQQKALVQLNELLFNDNEVLDMNKKFPETGNEPAGSTNPNIAPSQI